MRIFPKRIVLTGFMGAGKSTAGRLLAPQLGYRFRDADDEIAHSAGLSLPEIFSRHGEEHFRRLEAAAVERLLLLEDVVIALGGGALENLQTRLRLDTSQHTLLVHLQVTLEESLRRCHGAQGAAMRPVLADEAGLAARYAERTRRYQQADLSLETSGVAASVVVERLLDLMAAATGRAGDTLR